MAGMAGGSGVTAGLIWGFARGWLAAGAGGLCAGMPAARAASGCGAGAGVRGVPGPSRPYVAQAGSAARGGLPRQRSTGLAGRSRGPGRAAQGSGRGRCRRRLVRARPPCPRGGWPGCPVTRAFRAVRLVRLPPAAGQGDAAAGGGDGVPVGVVDGHEVDPAQQRRRRTRPGPSPAPPGRRGRPGRPARTPAGRPRRPRGRRPRRRRTMAWYFAAMTGLCSSSGVTARQAAVRSPGRPRREMREAPSNAPEEVSAGDRPACLTSDFEVS